MCDVINEVNGKNQRATETATEDEMGEKLIAKFYELEILKINLVKNKIKIIKKYMKVEHKHNDNACNV